MFCFLIFSCSEPEVSNTVTLEVKHIELQSPEDILPLKDSLVAPLLYSHIKGIDTLEVNEKKDKFISAILPAILVAKYRIEQNRNKVKKLLKKENWTAQDSTFYNHLCSEYGTDNQTVLLNRMVVHPNSIILAQAIIESGWGSSRVFQEANNMFGVWSYSLNEPRIAAKFQRDGETIYLRKYDDFADSIEDYLKTVARVNVYREFRAARLVTSDPFKLITHLAHYSERREEYVIELSAMIRFNGLTQFDRYILDPSYINLSGSIQ
ncbi:glucosaminidase domain-containing protein [Roseivirga echinicomitans]|uniref:glucosaminidase domain-containing protein n=1 Tax=Roseivirga echinicomitans TaxID=296218 RepID=UPI00155EFB95|nr:glucosaminidase domain-containing protein [Roseivirga echinicomitans]